jgi:hypothetical protein
MGESTYLEPEAGPAPDASLASLLCALSFASGLTLEVAAVAQDSAGRTLWRRRPW